MKHVFIITFITLCLLGACRTINFDTTIESAPVVEAAGNSNPEEEIGSDHKEQESVFIFGIIMNNFDNKKSEEKK
jgi:hypothetical protein